MAEYFYIENINNNSIPLELKKVGISSSNLPVLYYSSDKSSWNNFVIGGSYSIPANTKIYLKGVNNYFTYCTDYDVDSQCLIFDTMGNSINIGGNLSSLLVGDNMQDDTIVYCDYFGCFGNMFANADSTCSNSKVIDASELVCDVMGMCTYLTSFYFQSYLLNPPKLPATTLAYACYGGMFYYCTSLINLPELPPTTLARGCYNNMFAYCTSLKTLPKLPATTLTDSCYVSMFEGCTSIKLSTTQTGRYQVPYIIPSSGTGTTENNSLINMFIGTGGTFTGTPTINTTYYLFDYMERPYIGTKKLKDSYVNNKKVKSM